jgi:two-component system chemotaxis response regulator CheB
VQDPDDAEVPAMPLNAMRRGTIDYVIPVAEMARVITGLIMNAPQRHARTSPRSHSQKPETPGPERPGTDALRTGELGPPSPLTCPDCGGSLWEVKDHDLVRYRCHVGHGFNSDSLRNGMDEKLEDILSALRAIEEAIELRTRMMAHAKDRQLTEFTATLDREIAEMKGRANALRELLIGPAQQKRPRNGRRKRQAHG